MMDQDQRVVVGADTDEAADEVAVHAEQKADAGAGGDYGHHAGNGIAAVQDVSASSPTDRALPRKTNDLSSVIDDVNRSNSSCADNDDVAVVVVSVRC